MSATIQDPRLLHELAPGLHLARGGPGRTLNVYLLDTLVVDAGCAGADVAWPASSPGGSSARTC
jgi:hypothetical protein